MARKKAASKSVVSWDDKLAEAADIAAAVEVSTGGGQFFSVRSGQLQWQDMPLPNNEMAVIVIDSIFENVYYEGKYDPDVPQSPVCFAFDKVGEDLAPHVIVTDAGQSQSTEGCATCEHNEWGSADVGKGKACRNTRRLAMIPAGTFSRDGALELFDEPDHYATTTVGFMKLPVTSVKGYANFVKQVAGTLRRPLYGIVTRVSIVPDAKTQFKVVFEPLEKVPDELMDSVITRRKEVESTIDFPYTIDRDEEPAVPKKKPAVPKKKKSTTSKTGRRY